jgi:alpha-N-arabinofuranosidase
MLPVLCAVLVVGNCRAAEIENPFENASFEASADNKPVGWRTTTWAGQGSFDYASIGHTGKASVRISSDAGGDLSWRQVVPVEPFSRYRLSAWIKTENIKPGTGQGALLDIHDIQGVKTQVITGTQDWTRVECEFETVNTSVDVNCLFGGWGQSTGTAWYDDVRLEKIASVTPTSKTVEAKVAIDAGKTSEPISKYIYGQFIEHLGRCIYGGIWAEMLEDRKFYFPVPADGDPWRLTGSQARVLAASPWKVIGPDGSVAMKTDNPYVGRHTPEITLAGGKGAGIYQEELGLVKGKEYVGRIILAGDRGAAPVEVSLVWGEGDNQRQTVTVGRISGEYVKFPFSFRAKASTDNGKIEITSKGRGSFRIGAVSLMPADNVEGFRADTLALLRELDSPVYRWPGGNFVSGYDWRDGLGERDKRPTRTNPAWTGIETNDVGMDEFVRLCRLIDADPMIAVNTGFGDAYSAADEVEYANGSADTRYGKIRAQNGNGESYDVKWWCVGNEMFGSWQLGYMRLNHYVLKHNQVEEKMRQVDPSIKTIGVGNVGDWSRGMLTSCADHMDLLSEHFYCQNRGDIVEHVRQIPNQVKRIADAHREYRRTIDALKDKDIRVALDEWNYWYGPHVYGELGTTYFLKDALGIAAGLHEYFRNSDIYFMANYAQTVNVIGCIKTTKTQAGFDATALPLMLYRKHFGTIPVAVDDTPSPLDVSAAWTADKKALTVAVVNPTWDTYKLDIDLKNAGLKGPAATWVIAGDNPLLYNTPGQEEKVAIEEAGPTDLSKSVSLEPLSITLFRAATR